LRKPLDRELGQAAQRVPGLAGREQHHDRLGEQPSRYECQHLGRLSIQPLRVVHDTHQRMLRRDLGKQSQHRQADQKAIRHRTIPQPERDPQRVVLRTRKPFQTIQQWRAQLMKRRKGQLHFRLDAGCPDHGQIVCGVDHVREQRRLPDSGLAHHHHHAAASAARAVQHSIQYRALFSPTYQHRYAPGCSDDDRSGASILRPPFR
jgi:hypothetical protein